MDDISPKLTNPSDSTDSLVSDAAKPQPQARPSKPRKPLVEGINAPLAGSSFQAQKPADLTEAEKRLISSPVITQQKIPASKPLAQFMLPAKQPRLRALRLSLLGLIAVGLAWAGFIWYNNRPTDDTDNYIAPAQDFFEKLPPTTAPTATSAPPTVNSKPVAPATSTKPSQAVLQVKIKSTPTGYLNVRNGPSLGGKLIAKVKPGETYEYKTIKDGWYEILLPDGRIGWVLGKYASPVKTNGQ